MNADGSEPLNLTPDPGADSDPVWSPDGRRIAFVRGQREIYVMNADGSGQRRLARHATTSCSAPAWSPDGRKIAFVSGPRRTSSGSKPRDLVVNADGSGQRNLTRNPASRQRPRLVAGRTEDHLRAQLRDLRDERRRQRANEPNPQPCARLRPCLVTRRTSGSSSSAGSHDDSTALAPGAVERRSSRCT